MNSGTTESCKRCRTPLDDSNPATWCGHCHDFTLCLACAEDHACCVSDEQVRKDNAKDDARVGSPVAPPTGISLAQATP